MFDGDFKKKERRKHARILDWVITEPVALLNSSFLFLQLKLIFSERHSTHTRLRPHPWIVACCAAFFKLKGLLRPRVDLRLRRF